MIRKLLSLPFIFVILGITLSIGGSVVVANLFLGGGGAAGNINLEKGLAGHWKFNGDAQDSTPYNHDGTVTGAVLTTDPKGQSSKAYDFDGGASTNISVTDSTGSSLDLTTAVTVSAWVNVQTTGTKGIVSKGGAGGNEPNGPYSLWTIGTTIYWEVGDDVNNPSISSTLTAGTWQHWVGTYSSSSLSLYRNGVLVAGPTGVVVSSMVQNDNALLFADSTGTVTNLDAFIDDVRIYNRALSAAEITALYNLYDPGPVVSNLQKGLVGHWKFNGTAQDSTPNNNDGTVTEAVLTTDRKEQANKAYDFDGTNDIIQTANSLPIFNIASELTYSAWFYVDTGNSLWQRPFQKFQDLSGGNVPPWAISYGQSTAATFGCEFKDSDDAEFAQFQASSSSPSGSWYHVACVASQSAGTFDIYVNGIDVGGAAWFASGTIHTESRPITLGGARSAGTYWNGKIDDVRIYNRALSAAEITALYNSYDPGVAVSTLQKGLVTYLSMNGTAQDNTPYNNDGTAASGATLTADRRSASSKAYDFNGTSNATITLSAKPSSESADYSVAAWVKWDALDDGTVYNDNFNGTLVSGIGLTNDYGGSVNTIKFLLFTNTTPGGWDVDSAITPTTGTWYHVVGTYAHAASSENRVAKVYVDGVLKTTESPPAGGTAQGGGNAFVLGQHGAIYLDGAVDDFRYYNRVLSAAEILELYNSYR